MSSSLDPESIGGLNLDSDSPPSIAPGFFEGTEKLLEVWFHRRDGSLDGTDLQKIPRHELEVLMKLVKCEIISFKRNDSLDSYVLSESSMFISQRRFILKTCGTTTLLGCLNQLTSLAFEFSGFDEVEDIFYSRKNFLHPELQPDPHQSFSDEVKVLDSVFDDGAAYCLGQMNGDCWYLYTRNRLHPIRGDDDGYVSAGDSPLAVQRDGEPPSPVNSAVLERPNEPDQTLEVLMMDLDPEVMKIFTKDCCKNALEARVKSGISTLIPEVQIDDFLFDPCGYSMNGIMEKLPEASKGSYVTIHITPEPAFSYVSFESNIPMASYKEMLLNILNIFKPGKFIMTVFANQGSVATSSQKDLDGALKIGAYGRKDLQSCQFKTYHLTYAHYVKFPS